MEISSSAISHTQPLNSVIAAGNKSPEPKAADESGRVSLSAEARSMQQLEALYDEADSIFMSKLSVDDVKQVEKLYAELDNIFSSQGDGQIPSAETDKLFRQLDDVFQQAESLLSDDEREQIAQLEGEIVRLEEDLGIDDEEEFEDNADARTDDGGGLLSIQLSKQQKDELLSINANLQGLLSGLSLSDGKQEQIDNLFEALPDADKLKLAGIDEMIASLSRPAT